MLYCRSNAIKAIAKECYFLSVAQENHVTVVHDSGMLRTAMEINEPYFKKYMKFISVLNEKTAKYFNILSRKPVYKQN